MFFICIFLPAIISVIIDEKINHSKKSVRDLVVSYGSYLFVITMIMNTIFFFTESEVWFYSTKTFTYEFCFKYMWISFIISIILPYIVKCFRQCISINVEVKKVNKEVVNKDKKEEQKKVAVKEVKNEKSSNTEKEKSKRKKTTKKSR